jgi:predicted GH43/DUF377 family glycosyl hydrolase
MGLSLPSPALFRRQPVNPIIRAGDLPFAANSVFNPGATTAGGETVLLVRVEDLSGISHLRVARSSDGVGGWQFDTEPLISPDPVLHPEEVWGCEDPRLAWLDERGAWAITYTAYSRRGPLVALALTEDFRTVTRIGPVLPPENKDAALFPRRIGGRWAMINRPTPQLGPAGLWLCWSLDLQYWGDHALVLEPRDGPWWDSGKVGLGPPPLETPEGWLIMYHGVHITPGGPIYRAGLALLDLDDPTLVLRRSVNWVLAPSADFERIGDVGQVVFPCGWTVDAARDRLNVYYGAADTSVGLATASLRAVLAYLDACPAPTGDAPSRPHEGTAR